MQIVVPKTYTEFTSRRVLTTSWLEGEKLSGSKASDVGELVNLGVICYLKQLLDTGFFHVSSHPLPPGLPLPSACAAEEDTAVTLKRSLQTDAAACVAIGECTDAFAGCKSDAMKCPWMRGLCCLCQA